MNEKRQWVFERCERVALWEGLDDALIGVVTRCGMNDPIAVYERNALIRCLGRDLSFDDAVEWIDHNINGAYIGESTPFLLELAPRTKRRRNSRTGASAEVERLRAALAQIAENNDEPYARDFAKDILNRRETK